MSPLIWGTKAICRISLHQLPFLPHCVRALYIAAWQIWLLAGDISFVNSISAIALIPHLLRYLHPLRSASSCHLMIMILGTEKDGAVIGTG